MEAALLSHPGVIEASVYAIPDERLGEEVGATLYAPEPLDESDLRSYLASQLARFKIPRYLTISDAPLPRIASGKIDKRLKVDNRALCKVHDIEFEDVCFKAVARSRLGRTLRKQL